MTSWYAVLRWLPDPVAGECMNVGVVAWGHDRALWRVLRDTARLRAFDPRIPDSVDFEGWARRVAERCPTREDLERLVGSTSNAMACNQVHGPMASLATVEDLLDDVGARFLKEPPRAAAPEILAVLLVAAVGVTLLVCLCGWLSDDGGARRRGR